MKSIYGFSYSTPQPFKKKVTPTTSIYSKPNGFTSSKVTSPYGRTVTSDSKLSDTFTPKPIQTLINGQIKYDNGSVQGTPKVLPSVPTSKNQLPSNPTNSYNTDINNISNESIQFLKDKFGSDQAFYDSLYAKKNQSLGNQIPFLQKNFDQLKGDTEASINDATAGSEVAKQNVETQWGEGQRALAQTRRESEGRNNAKYAMLNTTDSYGEGSYGRAQENVESDFNRQTATGLQDLGNKKFQIGQELTTFVRQAKSFIMNEQTKLNSSLQQIADNMDLNEMEKAQLTKQAYEEFQGGILGIKQQLADLKYQQAQSSTANLSEQFLSTGIPTTAAEFEFLQKNKDAFANIGSNGPSSQKQQLIDLVDKISGGNVGSMTGLLKTAWVPGSSGAITKNYYDQLKGLLSLENRQKLKGSGSISDYEARTLDRAASALGQNLSESQFRQVLDELRTSLGGNQTQSPNSIQVGRFTVSQ